MSTRKKIYLVVYVACMLFVLFLLANVVMFIRKTPAVTPTAEEAADISIAQYIERRNASATNTSDFEKRSFVPPLFSQSDPVPDGCALRFAFTPVKKSLIPGSANNYTATITNKGKDTCKNVSLSVYYEGGEYFISSDPTPTASDYYWEIGDLSYLKRYTIDLRTKLENNNNKNIISSACATADNSSDVCSESVIFINKTAKNTTLTTMLQIPNISTALWGELFSEKEFGIWVWDSASKMTPTYATEVITNSKRNGFNAIYLTIDDYLPADKDDPVEKETYMKALSVFITAANSSGIQVDAVGGAKDWAQNENRWKGYMLIDFLNEYNTAYPNAKIRNLQYDVEPYLLSDYPIKKPHILKDFVEFIDESTKRLQSSSFGFSVVVPHFYDSSQLWTPSFIYNGSDAYTFTHLLKILERKQGSSIIVMSYRNFFEGDNGVQQISEAEIAEAANGGYNTKIIIAQETGNVSPDYITYYNHKKSDLFSSLSQIQSYFGTNRNYGGVAVHYFDPFLKLSD